MKRFLLLIFMAICISAIIPQKVHAFDLTAGLTTWYAWWDVDQGNKGSENMDPKFLIGPALAFKINDEFNITFVFLYGKYEHKGPQDSPSFSEKTKNKRSDSDLALNYKLHDYLKVFAGFKYMAYKKDKKGVVTSPLPPGMTTTPETEKNDHSGFGPGIGVSATYPIYDNIFLLATLSGFYLWGSEEVDSSRAGSGKINYREYGFNSTLAAAYYIAPASTVVSLGGRYQYFVAPYDDYVYPKHKFYGITLTATYTFSI